MISETFQRFGVTVTPAGDDPLARFGVRWTGWCPEQAVRYSRFTEQEIGVPYRAFTRRISTHGLHGLVVRCFQIAPSATYWAIQERLETLARQTPVLRLPPLRLALVTDRLALVPQVPSAALQRLLSQARDDLGGMIVDALPANDPAPGPPERAGDGRHALPRQEGARFHIPLTDPIPAAEAEVLAERLTPILQHSLRHGARFKWLVLAGNPGGGRPVRVLTRFPLQEERSANAPASFSVHGPRLDLPPLGSGTVPKAS